MDRKYTVHTGGLKEFGHGGYNLPDTQYTGEFKDAKAKRERKEKKERKKQEILAIKKKELKKRLFLIVGIIFLFILIWLMVKAI